MRSSAYMCEMEGGFNLFGDPDEFRARMEELSEQMQSSQRVAWADNAIKLAVEMTVASIGRLELTGSPDEQAMQVRDAIRILFPEAVPSSRGPRRPFLGPSRQGARFTGSVEAGIAGRPHGVDERARDVPPLPGQALRGASRAARAGA